MLCGYYKIKNENFQHVFIKNYDIFMKNEKIIDESHERTYNNNKIL